MDPLLLAKVPGAHEEQLVELVALAMPSFSDMTARKWYSWPSTTACELRLKEKCPGLT